MGEVPQSTVWYFRYLGESWMKLASKQPWLSPDQIQRQLWEQWIHGQVSGGRDANTNTNNGTGCVAEVQHGVALRQGDKLEAGLFSRSSECMVPSRELAASSKASPSPSISPQPGIPLYPVQPKTGPSGESPSFVNKTKDAEVRLSFAGGPILKHEEDQDQGFLLLLNQLAPVLERDGPMNKEQATLMVRRKWTEMGVEEKEVWRNMVGRGEKGEIQARSATEGSRTPNKDKQKEVSRDTANKGKKRETQGQGGKVRSVTPGPGSGTPNNKGTKVKKATNEKKTSPASSPRPLINSVPNSESAGNNLSICKKDITDVSKATNSPTGINANKIGAIEDSGSEDEGMQHLMTNLVPKLMEGGVPNLEVAQAMVTKKWGEMGVEEKASWIQMARSIRMMEKTAEPKRKKPTIGQFFTAVASNKINSEGASKENPNIASPQSPPVNHSEGNLKEGSSPQASENSHDMNFNSIEATAVNNEAKKVEESSPNEDRGAGGAVPNAEEINESANGPSSQGECRNSTMEAIASSSREAASENNKSEKFVDSKLGQKREREDDIESGSAKKKEQVEPGLIYLLAKLTTEMLKRGGVQTKEEAEQLVRDKWEAMPAEEKDVWTHLVMEENPMK